jgi:hypothetical protein
MIIGCGDRVYFSFGSFSTRARYQMNEAKEKKRQRRHTWDHILVFPLVRFSRVKVGMEKRVFVARS